MRALLRSSSCPEVVKSCKLPSCFILLCEVAAGSLPARGILQVARFSDAGMTAIQGLWPNLPHLLDLGPLNAGQTLVMSCLNCAHLEALACREEEASFSRTLSKGIERFKKAAGAATNGKLPSPDAFALWDSFGFPIDLTQVRRFS